MSIEKLKELYINKSNDIDNETRYFCKCVFGDQMDPNFGPIGLDYLYELIKLLGYTENYNNFNIDEIENLIGNDSEILKMLENTNENEYPRLREFFNASNIVKEKTYECIKNKLLQYKLELWRSNLNKIDIKYYELTTNSFKEEEGIYIAKNVLFHNLKAEKIEMFGNLQNGMETLKKIEQNYVDVDLKKLCADLIVRDNSDWDDRITTSDEVIKYLEDLVYITINKNELSIWFNTTEADLFGGHNPVLYLYSDKDYKFVGME